MKLIGETSGDNFGYSVSIASDVNDDGFVDVIVGAYHDDDGGSDSGCAFIFFGRYNWKPSVNASDANVKFIGDDGSDYFGSFVTSAGDINKDGLKDVVFSASHDDDGGNGSGCVFVFFGRTNWTSPIYASSANVKIVGEYNADNLGESISTAGDVNKDGINDLVVGAYGDDTGGNRAGCAYIFFGRTSWSSTIDASNANVKLIGEDADDWFGRKLSSGGDVNNDGIDDIVIGAYYDNDGGNGSGCAFIFFGRSSWQSSIDASNANVKLVGEDAGDLFGTGVNCFGDVNNDGITDVVIGASSDDDGDSVSGCVFIFFGRTNWTSIIDASLANVKIIGEDTYDRLGSDVCISKDINSDGKMDLILGAKTAGTGMDYWGNAYIFFGQDNWNPSYDASNSNVIIKGEANDDHFGDSLGAN